MTNEKEITKFDPNVLANQLRDKIRFEISQFLPEEVWEGLIKKEIDSFLKDKEEKNYYSNEKIIPNGLRMVVKEVLAEDAKRRLQKVLDSADWQTQPLSDGVLVSEYMMKLLIENADKIFASYISGVVGQVIETVKAQTWR